MSNATATRLSARQSEALALLRLAAERGVHYSAIEHDYADSVERGYVTPSTSRRGIKRATLLNLVERGLATTDEKQWKFFAA